MKLSGIKVMWMMKMFFCERYKLNHTVGTDNSDFGVYLFYE
jgi:hypothetical protein